MSNIHICNKTANTLLVAPVFPDLETLSFPNNIYPPTDSSIEKVKEIVANSRARVNQDQVNYLFEGSYKAFSVPVEYRNDSEMVKGYNGVSADDSFEFEVAIESFVEFLVEENDYKTSVVRFPEPSEIKHETPFPSHPLIKSVSINGQAISEKTHAIESDVLDRLIYAATDFLENCERGGGFIPYSETEEYFDLFIKE